MSLKKKKTELVPAAAGAEKYVPVDEDFVFIGGSSYVVADFLKNSI